MTLQIVAPSELTPKLQHEICEFLDSQNTTHPFQYPQWSSYRTILALGRSGARLIWFASCAVQYPLGARIPFCRALSITRGPVCDDAEISSACFAELAQYAGTQRDCVYIDISPERPDSAGDNLGFGKNGWARSGAQRLSLRLDLTRTCEDLFGEFRKNTRYEVRRAERSGMDVCFATSNAQIADFLEIYARTADRKNFSPDPPEHLREIILWLQSETNRGALLLASYKGVTLGGAVIVRAGTRCWYVWGASRQHEELNAGHILQWNALLWAKSHGCTEYDFGGYTPGAKSGPAWFKEGFGGTAVSFIPPRRRVLRPGYHWFVQQASKLR
jgi:peptidoglycan pentaglycine glycine transferase (the first glycine)